MTPNKEESLLQWIFSMDQRGCPAHVPEMANILLAQRNPTSPPTIGKNWVTKFIKRQPEIKSRHSGRYNYERAKCEDPKVIQEWFHQLSEIISQYGILEEDIFNFDETGFAMGLIATTKVVTISNMPGKPHPLQPGNREWVTTVECINANGWSIPT
jgi:hypothetical protein